MFEDRLPLGTVVGDARPGAPLLAARGAGAAGVRTIEFVRPNALDVPAGRVDGHFPRRDRRLQVECWYPAEPSEDMAPVTYTDHMGRRDRSNLVPYTFPGRAVRDTAIADGRWPVVVLSHGYPGSRYLLCHFAEQLSTRGYVVFAPGHTDNTYVDFALERSMESALIHRTMDQRAFLRALPGLNEEGFFAGHLMPEKTALMGYSMGGFGALRTLGARMGGPGMQMCESILEELAEEPDWKGFKDLKAAVLFAPAVFWFGDDGFSDITTPTLWACGTVDPMVHYPLVRRAWEQCAHSERWLLSLKDLGHNVANNPAPEMAQAAEWDVLHRWADPVWDTWRVNAVTRHFATAFLDWKLKGETDKAEYLRVPVERGTAPAEGSFTPDWPGFIPETTAGLEMEYRAPV